MTNYFTKYLIFSLLLLASLQSMVAMESNEKRPKIDYQQMDGELLNPEPDIDAPDQEGYTALHHAARSGNAELCQNLIDKGADYRILTPDGENCLMLAAENFNSDVIKLFLDKGLDINAQDDEGKTVLFHFYFAGNHIDEDFIFLLDLGANPNIQDNAGNTILMHLIKDDNDDDEEDIYPNNEVELLLQYDADPNLQNENEETALDVARIQSEYDPEYEGLRRIISTLSNPENIKAIRVRRENNPPVEQGLNALRRRYQAENLMQALQNRELGE